MKDRISQFEQLLEQHYPDRHREKIMQALHWASQLHAGQKRASGEPYLIHPMMVAEILTDLNMDYKTVMAGLLHDVVEDTDATLKDVEKRFDKEVSRLVDGVTKISSVSSENKMVQSSKTIQKTLFAMTEDIRVIIIKLADKYHNMSTLDHLPVEKQKRIAQECIDIYSPLAERLGMAWLKAELEDLSLLYLNPKVHQQITEALQFGKRTRDEFLNSVEKKIKRQAKKENLRFDIQVRAKHIYSIYNKMKKREKRMDEMYDLLGVRLICSTVPECYTILGMVHALWPPIERRFKDYIAMPKANQYQSLHTTVMCQDGQLLEIQIRTHQMHARAEFGVAAHWAYKKGMNHSRIKPEDLKIINTLKEWNPQADSEHFLKEIKEELLKDSIYVFTPKGQIIELPKDSTPIDFAYHIHTEVGNRCIGARRDNTIIPLHEPLRNTDVIEILTAKNGRPRANWLRIAKTARAKSKIRHWLIHYDNERQAEDLAIEKAKQKAVETTKEIPQKEAPLATDLLEQPRSQNYYDSGRLKINVGSEKNMMIKMAGCCHPVPGDPIIGYVSRGRGIIVHRRGCNNLPNIPEIQERSIDCEWSNESSAITTEFKILSEKIPDLFSQIEGAIRKTGGHLIQGQIEENEKGNLVGFFLIELKALPDFTKIKRSIRNIPAVLEITGGEMG